MFILEEENNKELETVEENTSNEEVKEESTEENIPVEETSTPNEVKEETETEEKTVEEDSKPETNEEVKEDSEVKAEESSTDKETKPKKAKPDSWSPIGDEFLPGKFNPFARPVNPRFANRKVIETDIEERVVKVKRVIKTTKGGRRFKFSVLVVVGDKKGKVGYAIGKHIEIPEAIKKASRSAKKNMYRVNVVGEQDTIPHEIIGHHGAARVMLKPAKEGKGIIASDVVRTVVELAGVRNIYSKNLGSNNAHNVVHATVKALATTKTKDQITSLRSKVTRVTSFQKREEGNKK